MDQADADDEDDGARSGEQQPPTNEALTKVAEVLAPVGLGGLVMMLGGWAGIAVASGTLLLKVAPYAARHGAPERARRTTSYWVEAARLVQQGQISAADLDPGVKRRLVEEVKTANAAEDPAAVPLLVRLVALYDRDRDDTFFRAASRVLCELRRDELHDLEQLAVAFEERAVWEEHADEDDGDEVGIQLKVDRRNGVVTVERLTRPPQGGSVVYRGVIPPETPWLVLTSWRRLFHVLKQQGLAADGSSGGDGTTDHSAIIETKTMHAFYAVFGRG